MRSKWSTSELPRRHRRPRRAAGAGRRSPWRSRPCAAAGPAARRHGSPRSRRSCSSKVRASRIDDLLLDVPLGGQQLGEPAERGGLLMSETSGDRGVRPISSSTRSTGRGWWPARGRCWSLAVAAHHHDVVAEGEHLVSELRSIVGWFHRREGRCGRSRAKAGPRRTSPRRRRLVRRRKSRASVWPGRVVDQEAQPGQLEVSGRRRAPRRERAPRTSTCRTSHRAGLGGHVRPSGH